MKLIMLLVCTHLNLGPPALFYLYMQPAVADKAMEFFDQNGDGQVNLLRDELCQSKTTSSNDQEQPEFELQPELDQQRA